ncbi:type II toxin-antitoxin system HicB family antitoxin [Candidatus Uhrbacteria bacterium]|nr:type II toxin-antitoxin system HicB family antitoxin [Candidatus Uhrbacteria bacterium]
MKDGGYTVTIPALPGCISEGDTFEAAMANIKEAAVLYVEVMKERHVKDFFEQKAHVIIAPLELAI